MSKKLVYALILIVFTIMLGAVFRVRRVEAIGFVYIRSNGSVDPPSAPISTIDNMTYTLTDNILNETIVVERDNVIVDGVGYTIRGADLYFFKGISISGRNNVTIMNMTISTFDPPIWINYSSNIRIIENRIFGNCSENDSGIHIEVSSNISIIGNLIMGTNYQGIWINDQSPHNKIVGNNITGNFRYGMRIYSSYNNITANTIASNFYEGVWFSHSLGNMVSKNKIIGNGISSQGNGLWFGSSSNQSIVFKNNITNCPYGIVFIHSSSNNSVFENNIMENQNGIWMYDSSNHNKIYHNNFINNTVHALVENSMNIWDDNYPSGGNYWSNYTDIDQYSGPYQNITGNDEIWDHPYVIDESNQDNYPLVPEFSSLLVLPLFMIATLLAVIVYRRKHTI